MLNQHLLIQFSEFLDKKIGLYFPKERWQDLEKKLINIKNSFGFEDTAACLEWIMKSPIDKDKLDILTSYLTIGETYFFRDKQIFTILSQKIIPDILSRHSRDRSLRIWSAACCTGEEPYSIAILLHRIIPDIKDWKIFILGTDINPNFLNKGVNATYKKWSFRTTPLEIVQRYFKKNTDDSFKLISEIQKMVTFRHFNLVDDINPNEANVFCEMDLIFCHNVLIYFSENQIKKTVQKLSASLCNHGWLSVTAIETPFISEAMLKPYRYPGAVLFKKEITQSPDPQKFYPVNASSLKKKVFKKTDSFPPSPQKSSEIEVSKKVKKTGNIFDESFLFYEQKAYHQVIILLRPYLVLLQNEPIALKEHFEEVILLIRSYANQGDLSSALEWSERALQVNSLDFRLHYLHAIFLHDQGDIREAIKSMKRALFIDSNFVMAYLMLGIFEKEQENKTAALHYFKTALDLIEKNPPENTVLNVENYSIEYLKDLIFNNMKNL